MKRKWNSKYKKPLLAVVSVVLVAALGAGIWFGARGGGEAVKVYSFLDLGMTEYWGDSQESYGPVSTDKIQTVYLSDTQTVTEVLVSEGDEVREGDVLMTYDTTLSELELERKRLDVERQKLDLQDAKNQLNKIRNMKPMDPNAWDVEIPVPEINLGDKLELSYEISETKEYDGSDVTKSLILWMKDGGNINDAILRQLYLTALDYQKQNETTDRPNTSAAEPPEVLSEESSEEKEEKKEEDKETQNEDTPPSGSTGSTDPKEPTGQTDHTTQGNQNNQNNTELDKQEPSQDTVVPQSNGPEITIITGNNQDVDDAQDKKVEIRYFYNGAQIATAEVEGGQTICNACARDNKTYWFKKADRSADGAELVSLTIPACPEDAEEAARWDDLWGKGVNVECVRDIQVEYHPDATVLESGVLVNLDAGKEAALAFSVTMPGVPTSGGKWTWTVQPTSGEGKLEQLTNGGNLILAGNPGEAGSWTTYSVTARYDFVDNRNTSRAVATSFELNVNVGEASVPDTPASDYYMILKITQDDMSRGERLIWQGIHVLCYDDGSFGFSLFDASALEDHTLEVLEEEPIELPEIDIGSGYTAAEIAKMRAEQEKVVKEKDLALRMAEAEYKLMEAEVNDGAIRAQFDGQVVGLLTEDQAREEKRPMLKLSAGGGFYVDCSVSELVMDDLRIGAEVTVNDWNTGMTYTGTISSKGDLPVDPNGWSSSENMNASYYPFTVFVDSEADLQAGSYVSVTYSTASSEHGIYLQKPFLRAENGRSYVYLRGADGRLEKRYVRVGKSLWGSYTEVTAGLTEEDFIAFPYGKAVKEGAPTAEGDLADLYGY